MGLPTVKMMVRYGFKEEQAKQIRSIMEEYPLLMHDEQIIHSLNRISEVMDMFGCEYIAKGSNKQSPAIYYVNTGETYQTTIMFIDNRFVVGNWGSIVERGNYA